jgi:dipeptidase E
MPRHVVALGGGGFSMEPENPLLDDFVLSLARTSRPRVLFVPTASGDNPPYIVRFYRTFAQKPCVAADLTFFGGSALDRRPKRSDELRSFVLDHDVVYVGGGNVANLLVLWRTHGLDAIFREAWSEGIVLAGVSAGMNCWFDACITDSFGDLRPLDDGLGLIRGSACPHYDGEPGRRPAYHAAIAGGLAGGFAADDGAALHFEGDDLAEAVSSRPGASGYSVALRDGTIEETPIATRYLGA